MDSYIQLPDSFACISRRISVGSFITALHPHFSRAAGSVDYTVLLAVLIPVFSGNDGSQMIESPVEFHGEYFAESIISLVELVILAVKLGTVFLRTPHIDTALICSSITGFRLVMHCQLRFGLVLDRARIGGRYCAVSNSDIFLFRDGEVPVRVTGRMVPIIVAVVENEFQFPVDQGHRSGIVAVAGFGHFVPGDFRPSVSSPRRLMVDMRIAPASPVINSNTVISVFLFRLRLVFSRIQGIGLLSALPGAFECFCIDRYSRVRRNRCFKRAVCTDSNSG